MDMELFKTELKDLFNKHSIILDKMDLTSTGYETLANPNNSQILHNNYYRIDIECKFVETVLK